MENKLHIVATFSVILPALLIAGCVSANAQPDSKSLSEIVGELIIEFDASYIESGDPYPFGSGPISTVFEENYREYVKDFPKEERFTYFWAGLWNLRFQGGSMDLFVDVVRSDPAATEFVVELRRFVERSNEGGRSGWRTLYAEGALNLLAGSDSGQ